MTVRRNREFWRKAQREGLRHETHVARASSSYRRRLAVEGCPEDCLVPVDVLRGGPEVLPHKGTHSGDGCRSLQCY